MKRILINPRFWVGLFPYLWYLTFFLLPFLIIFRISFSEYVLQVPPFSDLLIIAEDNIKIFISYYNYKFIIEDDLYLFSYLNTLRISGICALATLIIGYPIAYIIFKVPEKYRNLALLLVILPSWTSFLIRIYAWVGILKNEGLLNDLLIYIGIIEEPLKILYTETAIYIGVVYAYLPFMVLPIYSVLTKLDWSLVEAAMDLGCGRLKSFFKVTVPLTKNGIIAGFMLVFIPTLGEFVIPDQLGPSNAKMLGKVIWDEFFTNKDWPLASGVTVFLLAILIIPIRIFHNSQKKDLL